MSQQRAANGLGSLVHVGGEGPVRQIQEIDVGDSENLQRVGRLLMSAIRVLVAISDLFDTARAIGEKEACDIRA